MNNPEPGSSASDAEAPDCSTTHQAAGAFHSGFVGIIGKPNVGKSTILNYLLGHKVSIVSPRPQTTRHRILGILTRQDAQAIFIDSPGWHQSKHPFERHLVKVAKGVIEEANVLLTVIDATSTITKEDRWVFDEVRRTKRPAILAINKVDLVKKHVVLPLLEAGAASHLFQEHIPISAVTGDNMAVLLAQLIARLPEGPRWYEADQLTDQSTEQLVCEFVREQVLRATRQEVPQAVTVVLEELTRQESMTVIRATIIVEREGQKAIVIGRGGLMLKRIGTAARLDLERWLGRKVFLELWVKVVADWRTDPGRLRELGYERSS